MYANTPDLLLFPRALTLAHGSDSEHSLHADSRHQDVCSRKDREHCDALHYEG